VKRSGAIYLLIGIGGTIILFALKVIPEYVISTIFAWSLCIAALLVDHFCMAIREWNDRDDN
jgi:hypothetical protein